jgi:hypothetical protein
MIQNNRCINCISVGIHSTTPIDTQMDLKTGSSQQGQKISSTDVKSV